MKKLFWILVASAAMLVAQEGPAVPDSVTRMIEVKQNSVDNILGTLRPLFGNMMTITGDSSRHLIIVRGPSAVVNSFAETVAKLDVPAVDAKTAANVEVTIHLLYGSAKGESNAKVPQELDGTIRQLRSVFPYASYRVMDTLLLRGRDGRDTNDSGTLPGTDTFYDFRFHADVAPGPAPHTVRLRDLRLGMRMKMASGTFTLPGGDSTPNTQFQIVNVGISTDLDAREGQKTVVGKSNVSGTDDAIILVVSPKVIE